MIKINGEKGILEIKGEEAEVLAEIATLLQTIREKGIIEDERLRHIVELGLSKDIHEFMKESLNKKLDELKSILEEIKDEDE